ncbi:MAG: hypothetical protein ACR2IF_07395 [Terriglobales bacterium]
MARRMLAALVLFLRIFVWAQGVLDQTRVSWPSLSWLQATTLRCRERKFLPQTVVEREQRLQFCGGGNMSQYSTPVKIFVGGFVFAMLTCMAPVFAAAQSNPLNFRDNFFVTGDYVVAGAYGMNGANSFLTVGSILYTKGTITVPDTQNPGITGATSVPKGADIVAAFLYWETVESNNNLGAGQNGFFLPNPNGWGGAGPNGGLGYAIQGTNVSPSGNVAWSNGGCPSTSTGRTVSVYRANVIGALPRDASGNVLAGSSGAPQSYQLTLPSSSTGSPPITLGATLVIVYRVLSTDFPLNSIVIYDGAYGQSTLNVAAGSLNMQQAVQGFYDAAANPVTKLTHIVGSGQNNKFQTAYFGTDPNNLLALPSLYPNGLPTFPGWYGDWDNVTWTFGDQNYPFPQNPVGPNLTSSGLSPYPTANLSLNPLQEDAASATTKVLPTTSQQGCVDWGAVIVETRVKDSDGDGLLDSWEANHGYCDAAINNGVCTVGNPASGWVDLPNSDVNVKDVYVQLDYMCSNKVSGSNACDLSQPGSYSFNPYLTVAPDGNDVITEVTNAFADQYADAKARHKAVNLHVFPAWAIQEPACTDLIAGCGNPVYTPVPNQPGVVYWKSGFATVKNQLVDPNGDTSACTATPPPASCVPRFQHGRKDSWHYVLFAHGLVRGKWNFLAGVTVSQSGTSVRFTTPTAHGLVKDSTLGNGRVTINGAISNPNLNGTWLVSDVSCQTNPVTSVASDCSVQNTAPGPYSFTVQIATANGARATYTQQTDPDLNAFSGKAGTIGGWSDVGGADSLISLGNWPATDVTWNVKAATFMHEVGHTLGLTHGGLYYKQLSPTPSPDPSLNDYTPAIGENCKPNFLSVMNYLFAFDLLDNQWLDYAEESTDPGTLPVLNEGGPSTSFSSNYYSNTSWYAPTTAVGGSAATRHCDGTPIISGIGAQQMTEVTNQPTTSLSWSSGQDINFDGNSSGIFLGHSDWGPLTLPSATLNPASSPVVDLRQISSAAFSSVSGGTNGAIGGTNGAIGGTNGAIGGTNGAIGGTNGAIGGTNGAIGGTNGAIGGSNEEPTHESANSFARPVRSVTASEGVSPRTITVSWQRPIFGTPIIYYVSRSAAGGPFTQIAAVPPSTTTYTDTVTCNPGGYSYFVNSVVVADTILSGTVNTNGTAVTWLSGNDFSSLFAPSQPIIINGVQYVVQVINSATSLTLTTSAGNQSGVAYSASQQLKSANSNIAPAANPSLLTGCYTNAPGSSISLNQVSFSTSLVKVGTIIPVTWGFQDDNLSNNVYPFVNNLRASQLVAIGPTAYNNSTKTCAAYTATTPTRTLVPLGSTGSASYSVSNASPYVFTFNWNTSGFTSGCYYLKLTLDSWATSCSGQPGSSSSACSSQTKTSTSAVPLK